MPRDHQRSFIDQPQQLINAVDHPLQRAAVEIIEIRRQIAAAHEQVPRHQHVALVEQDDGIAIGVRGPRIFQFD